MKSIVEIAIGIIILYFLFSGVRRGLIRQVLAVVGIIAAFISSFYLAHHFAAFLESKINVSYNICLLLSAVILFAGTIILFNFVALGLKKLVNMTILGPFDRIMGGLFGAIKGVLLTSLILVVISSLPVSESFKKDLEEDRLVSFVKPVLPVLFDMIISIGHEELDFDKIVRSKKHLMEKNKNRIEEIKNSYDKKKKKIREKVPGTDLLQL
jgi:membrane protein required for colicin V production